MWNPSFFSIFFFKTSYFINKQGKYLNFKKKIVQKSHILHLEIVQKKVDSISS